MIMSKKDRNSSRNSSKLEQLEQLSEQLRTGPGNSRSDLRLSLFPGWWEQRGTAVAGHCSVLFLSIERNR